MHQNSNIVLILPMFVNFAANTSLTPNALISIKYKTTNAET